MLLAFVIYQQLRTRTINDRQLIVLPVILAVLGISNLSKHPLDSTAAGVALAVSVVVAIVFGIGRGISTEVWRSGGRLMRRGTKITLILWIVSLAARIVVGIVAQRKSVSSSVTAGELPLFLGVTLAVQNAVIWWRGQQATTSEVMGTPLTGPRGG